MPTIDEVPGPQWGRFTWDCLPGLVSYMTLSAHDLEPRVIVALTRFSAQWICAVPEVATLAGLAPKIWRTANEAPRNAAATKQRQAAVTYSRFIPRTRG